jgi:hypothetical protein
MSTRIRVLLTGAVLVISSLAAAAAEPPPPAASQPPVEAVPPGQIEVRLKKIEKIVVDLAKGRAELGAGMKEMIGKNQMSQGEARKLCETVGDQSKAMSLLGGQIALLEREENQKSMSGKQRTRLAKARATLDGTPPKMDCSAF